MSNAWTYALVVSFLSCAAISCTDTNFGSGSGKSNTSDGGKGNPGNGSGGNPGGDPGSGGPSECVNGDKVNVAWTGDVKDCIIDEGKTYNFEAKKCAEMRQANFDCNWETLVDEMKGMGLQPTEKINAARSSGAKLVTCGQAQDSRRIVVQWINPPEGGFNCDDSGNSRGLITTGCYTVYANGEAPPEATSDTEKRAQVYACMNQL